MRQIKFRAWDKRLKKMVQNSAYNITMTGVFNLDNDRVDYLDLMQFTGLKDKNKTDIYEGDIVKIEGAKPLCKVIWDEKRCGFIFWSIDPKSDFRIPLVGMTEVIGNIYENTELLKEIKK